MSPMAGIEYEALSIPVLLPLSEVDMIAVMLSSGEVPRVFVR